MTSRQKHSIESSAKMPEIIFESNVGNGVVFEKTSYKNGRCKVAVKIKSSGYIDMIYRFKNVPVLDSQYISWGNLSYCSGWNSDITYLTTSVQCGKKLFAGIDLSIYEADFVQMQLERFGRKLLVENEARAMIQELKDSLPSDCLLLQEEPDRQNHMGMTIYFDICKKGSISDFIDLDSVFTAYERLGVQISADAANQIRELCRVHIEYYAGKAAPFRYSDASNGVELVVTGLLLGYPLESTAWLIERNELFHVHA